MVLFIGDMHFGRGTATAEREKERALIDCLEAHADCADRLVLMGDVFDAYIEYRTLVPKGFARLQGCLAEWADRGVPILYLAGNHDLWHQGYFERELGVRVEPVRWAGALGERRAVLTHGDAYDTSDPLYRRLRPLLRSRAVVNAYRRLLPAGGALALAQRFNRAFHDERIQMDRVRALREQARRLLRRTSAELVVMGHSHQAERRVWPEGTYLNTGSWHTDRVFATLPPGGAPRLMRWNAARAEGIQTHGPTRPA